MYKCLTIALLSITISACNTTPDLISNDDCINNNWVDTGYNTAISGKSVRHFNSYIEQCGEKLADNAKATYIEGFKKGIQEYCTYENGYEVGSKSKLNSNTCPYELRTEFNKGYKVATIHLKEAKAKMDQLSEDMQEKKRVHARAEMAASMGNSK